MHVAFEILINELKESRNPKDAKVILGIVNLINKKYTSTSDFYSKEEEEEIKNLCNSFLNEGNNETS